MARLCWRDSRIAISVLLEMQKLAHGMVATCSLILHPALFAATYGEAYLFQYIRRAQLLPLHQPSFQLARRKYGVVKGTEYNLTGEI